MGTARGDLSRLAKAHERVVKLEAQLAEARREQDAILVEAMAHPENTYVVVNERTGLSRATISKAKSRA